jgi:rubredoxin
VKFYLYILFSFFEKANERNRQFRQQSLYKMRRFYVTERGLKMDKWECTVCGYIYDPENGDPEHNIQPGTPFEQLPENWTCPVCGAPKSQFIKRQ